MTHVPARLPLAAVPGPRATDRGDLCLRATSVTKLFGETVALWDVAFSARAGRLVSVEGPNGSGKSTLLRILAGLAAPTGGQVTWIRGSLARRPIIALVGHRTHLFDDLSALENITLAARLARSDAARAARFLDRLGVERFSGARTAGLSAGTRRRVGLARALATDPDALFVDEPFASLDGDSADLVATVLLEAAQEGRVVVIATHDGVRSATIAAERVWLDGGRIVGAPAQVVRSGSGADAR